MPSWRVLLLVRVQRKLVGQNDPLTFLLRSETFCSLRNVFSFGDTRFLMVERHPPRPLRPPCALMPHTSKMQKRARQHIARHTHTHTHADGTASDCLRTSGWILVTGPSRGCMRGGAGHWEGEVGSTWWSERRRGSQTDKERRRGGEGRRSGGDTWGKEKLRLADSSWREWSTHLTHRFRSRGSGGTGRGTVGRRESGGACRKRGGGGGDSGDVALVEMTTLDFWVQTRQALLLASDEFYRATYHFLHELQEICHLAPKNRRQTLQPGPVLCQTSLSWVPVDHIQRKMK